jgi:hypothetical protein
MVSKMHVHEHGRRDRVNDRWDEAEKEKEGVGDVSETIEFG